MVRKILYFIMGLLISFSSIYSVIKIIEINKQENTLLGREIDKRLKINIKRQNGDLKKFKEYQQVFNLLYGQENWEQRAYNSCNYFAQLRSKKQYYLQLHNYIKSKKNAISINRQTDKEQILKTLEEVFSMASMQIYCPSELTSFQRLRDNDVETEIKQQLKIETTNIKGDLEEYETVFNLLYQFENFEQMGQQYCYYFQNLSSKQQHVNDLNKYIKTKKSYIFEKNVTAILEFMKNTNNSLEGWKNKNYQLPNFYNNGNKSDFLDELYSTIYEFNNPHILETKTDIEKILRTIDKSVIKGSMEVHCPLQKQRLKKLYILN